MSFIKSINPFHHEDPSKAAKPYYEQVPGQLHKAYDPYVNAGKGALDQTQNEYGELLGHRSELEDSLMQLLQNPEGLYKNLTQNYTSSPGYEFAQKEAQRATGNAAAAGGYAGTPQHQRYAAEVSSGLASQDFDKYLSSILEMFMKGLSGTGNLYEKGLGGLEDIRHEGYGASSELGQSLANNLMSQGNLAYEGAAARNKRASSIFSDLASLGGSIVGGGA